MLSAREVLQTAPIIPVIALEDASKAVALAKALQDGGINVMEITLRTADAIKAIELIAVTLPSMVVGAGTVLTPQQYQAVEEAGAQFVISPGGTKQLFEHAKNSKIPLIPGVATASEIMQGIEYGYDTFKLFPANIAGATAALKAFSGPFSQVQFCPTGGVNVDNLNNYLSYSNVACVGGTWLTPHIEIENSKFEEITQRCKTALALLKRESDVF